MAYSSRGKRAYRRRGRIPATIAEPADRRAHRKAREQAGGRPPAFDARAERDRRAVECGAEPLKLVRAVATRYDELALRYEAAVQTAVADTWLRGLATAPF
ncbi:hypothetical protein GCM10023224_17870 [Streptomonospora halophila]|uniref:Transposase n=1 Tax=Streptomonospora halophila TaxID=427369 RepID=A0ABP9GKK2_9ACTN